MAFCPNCATMLAPPYRFCPGCGAPQAPVPPGQMQQMMPASRQPVVTMSGPGFGVYAQTAGGPPPSQQVPSAPYQQQSGPAPRPCAFCNGSGEHPQNFGSPCPVCGGRGANAIYQPAQPCARCSGNGREPFNLFTPCQTCGGKGWATIR